MVSKTNQEDFVKDWTLLINQAKDLMLHMLLNRVDVDSECSPFNKEAFKRAEVVYGENIGSIMMKKYPEYNLFLEFYDKEKLYIPKEIKDSISEEEVENLFNSQLDNDLALIDKFYSHELKQICHNEFINLYKKSLDTLYNTIPLHHIDESEPGYFGSIHKRPVNERPMEKNTHHFILQENSNHLEDRKAFVQIARTSNDAKGPAFNNIVWTNKQDLVSREFKGYFYDTVQIKDIQALDQTVAKLVDIGEFEAVQKLAITASVKKHGGIAMYSSYSLETQNLEPYAKTYNFFNQVIYRGGPIPGIIGANQDNKIVTKAFERMNETISTLDQNGLLDNCLPEYSAKLNMILLNNYQASIHDSFAAIKNHYSDDINEIFSSDYDYQKSHKPNYMKQAMTMNGLPTFSRKDAGLEYKSYEYYSDFLGGCDPEMIVD
jgi:hypothetical protein